MKRDVNLTLLGQIVEAWEGRYPAWQHSLVRRFPLVLSEMLRPSAALHSSEARSLARWGVECGRGWAGILERLFERLEPEIARAPLLERDRFRAVQIKEKFARLTVYLDSTGTPEMERALHDARNESGKTCEICGEAGGIVERNGWLFARCLADERTGLALAT
jgi:hypothetical protein